MAAMSYNGPERYPGQTRRPISSPWRQAISVCNQKRFSLRCLGFAQTGPRTRPRRAVAPTEQHSGRPAPLRSAGEWAGRLIHPRSTPSRTHMPTGGPPSKPRARAVRAAASTAAAERRAGQIR
eukprot:scaffold893_cov336-Prasinococcus_capsulatus_cf.AAC.10